MIVRKFKKIVSEGQTFMVLTILFALITRLFYYFSTDVDTPCNACNHQGLLWVYIEPYLKDNIALSLLLSSLCVCILAALTYHINTKYVLIRAKTTLTISLTLLLFSFSPLFYIASIHYITAICILVVISSLFAAYNADHKQPHVLNASISLAIGSLFDVSILAYLPVLWMGIVLMRSFSFKTFLITLFALFIVYVPVVSLHVYYGEMDMFLAPYHAFGSDTMSNLPIYEFSSLDWTLLIFTGAIFTLIFTNNYLNSYRDKIRVRACNTLLALFVISSAAGFMLININIFTFQFVALATGALVLAHFYALVEERWKMFLFVLQLGAYFIVCLFRLGTLG